MEFRVEIEDTDTFGVIYGPRIGVWTSRCFQHSLASHGIDLLALTQETHLPIFKSTTEILLPLKLGDRIQAELICREQRERSFSFEVRFYKGEKLAAIGTMVHVATDPATGCKQPLPTKIATWLGSVS